MVGKNIVAKREDSIYLFGDDRDAAVAPPTGYDSVIGHLLQHSRWNDWRFNVLRNHEGCGDEGKKASVKWMKL